MRTTAARGVWVLGLLFFFSSDATAQIVETRSGDANPMVSVFKSTIYGGGAGLVLGAAIALVSDSDGDAVKWGFVSGTFFGFAYGVYHVSTRSEPGRALLQREGPVLAWHVPEVRVERNRTELVASARPWTHVEMNVLRFDF